jgi:guanylate kinase
LKSKGLFIVVSGPSGSGKNSILRMVLPKMTDLRYSVSVTTRPPRPGEVSGDDYIFVSDEEFDSLIQSDKLLEWAAFCGYRYGTPYSFVRQCLDNGESVITDIDIQGARQIKKKMPEGVFVFIMPPSLEELRRRLTTRGTEDKEVVEQRLSTALREMEAVVEYDYWIINDRLEKAAFQLEAIIMAEKQKVLRLGSSLSAYVLEGRGNGK